MLARRRACEGSQGDFRSAIFKRPQQLRHPSPPLGAQPTFKAMTEQRKAVIKNADMSEDMQQDAVDCASQALSKYNIEKVSAAGLWTKNHPDRAPKIGSRNDDVGLP